MDNPRIEPTNVFECKECDYEEWLPADEQRWHMRAELIELGGTDDQYALYKCPECETVSWSHIEDFEYDSE